MFRTKQDAEKRLSGFLMDDLPIVSVAARPVPIAPDWFQKFRIERKNFLMSLGDSVSELALLNLSQDDFMGLLTASRIPENLCVKFRRPILYGGEISADNMFLMMAQPSGFYLNVFMAEQYGAPEIWHPNPEKKIYISIATLGGGDGGNATTDRLAQGFAAQMRSGRE